MQVGVTWEKRHPIEDFCKNTADCPDVDRARVRCVTYQQLGGSIPPGGDIISVLVCCLLFERAGKTKIAELHHSMLAYEQVFRLDIAMHDLFLMQEVVRGEYLVCDFLHLLQRQSVWGRLQLLKKSFLDIIKDEVQFSVLAEHLAQVDDVLVSELLEDLDFSHHGLAHVGVLVLRLLELLDGNHPPCFFLLGFENFAVSPFADHCEDPVLVHLKY